MSRLLRVKNVTVLVQSSVPEVKLVAIYKMTQFMGIQPHEIFKIVLSPMRLMFEIINKRIN